MWIDFVKDFAKSKEIKYTEALKSAQCKEEYHKKKASITPTDVKEVTRPKTPKTPRVKKEVMTEPIAEPMDKPIKVKKVMKVYKEGKQVKSEMVDNEIKVKKTRVTKAK